MENHWTPGILAGKTDWTPCSLVTWSPAAEGGERLQSPAEDPLLESVCPQSLASCWTPCRNPDRRPFGKGPLAQTLTLASFITDISQAVEAVTQGRGELGLSAWRMLLLVWNPAWLLPSVSRLTQSSGRANSGDMSLSKSEDLRSWSCVKRYQWIKRHVA